MLINSAFIAIDEFDIFSGVGGAGDPNFNSELGFDDTVPEVRLNPADPTFIFGNFPEGLRLLGRLALGFAIPGAFIMQFLPPTGADGILGTADDLTAISVFATVMISLPIWYKYITFFLQFLSNRSFKGVE